MAPRANIMARALLHASAPSARFRTCCTRINLVYKAPIYICMYVYVWIWGIYTIQYYIIVNKAPSARFFFPRTNEKPDRTLPEAIILMSFFSPAPIYTHTHQEEAEGSTPVHTNTHTHTHTHTHTKKKLRAYTHTHTHTHTQTHRHRQTDTHTHTPRRSWGAYKHTQTHADTQTHRHTDTQTHTHTHTHQEEAGESTREPPREACQRSCWTPAAPLPCLPIYMYVYILPEFSNIYIYTYFN
jgi:hypothetical protein